MGNKKIRPDEVNEFISNSLNFPAALDPGVYSVPNKNEYQKQKKRCFWGVKLRPVREADNLAVISEANF
jgi:hypothetical protein